jgi:predicted RNase H-like nuclease (RuvC/YqgF family)
MAISLSGCVTFGNKKELENQGLKNQITALETQLQSKDQEILNLRDELNRASEQKIVEVSNKKMPIEPKLRPKVRHIQVALRNAGYDPGKVDGRMGNKTVEAIKAFQRANNLPASGKVDKKTWEILRGYLVQKIK